MTDAVAVTSASSMPVTQAADQPSQDLTASHVEPIDISELQSTAITEPPATDADTDTDAVAFDLTVSKPVPSCPVTSTATVSTAADSDVTFISQTSAAVLSEEYRTRYEKYENLCSLITTKDRELAELNDERKRLHQMLVELQRAILTRPVDVSAAAPVDGPSTAAPEAATADKSRDKKEGNDSERDPMTAAAATSAVAYRRRPAHRGVTSVRVMVKSTQPPTAHSTKINLLRYNSLFCNYDDATTGRRKPPTTTEVAAAAANEDAAAASIIQATDLTSRGSERSTDSSEEFAVQPPSSTAVPEEPCPVKDDKALVHHTKGKRLSEDDGGGYAGDARPATLTRKEPVQQQQQRHPIDDDGQTSAVVLESYVSHQETPVAQNMTVSHEVGPSVAYTLPDDSPRPARQTADATRHQFAVATSTETIMSTARDRRAPDEQRPVVLSTMRPELSLVMTSPGKRWSSGVEAEVPARSMTERRELRPPPPYPHRVPEHPHPYSATVAPVPPPREQAAGIQTSCGQMDLSTAHTAAAYVYRKENSIGPRTGYVQPMRAENQALAVVPSSAACMGREMEIMGTRGQPCSDVSPRGHAFGEGLFHGSRMSPPAIPRRVGIRTTYDQAYYLQHVSADMAQPPRPRNNAGYHGNRLSNPQTSRSDGGGVHQQLVHASPPCTTIVDPRHVTMTSSAAHDVINRYPVDPRPLDQLRHFVGGRAMPAGPPPPLDAGDPRLRRMSPPSPKMMSSGHLNNVDGRGYGPLPVGAEYPQQDAAVPLVRDCHVINETDFARRGAGMSSYQAMTGHSPRFPPPGANVPPPPPSLRRDPIPSPPLPPPPRGLPHSVAAGPAAVPLDMSGAKHRRYSSLNQVLAGNCRNRID